MRLQHIDDGWQLAAGAVQLAQVRQGASPPLQLPGQALYIWHACIKVAAACQCNAGMGLSLQQAAA